MNTSLLRPGLAALALLAASLAAPVSAQTVIKQWDFSETNGTLLTGTSTTGTVSGTWTASITGVATNGTGALKVGSTGSSATTYSSLGTVSSGIVTMNVYVLSYNFTSSEAFGFGFYNANTASGATVERALFQTDSTTTPTAVQLNTIGAAADGDSTNTGSLALSGSNLLLSLSINKDANTFSLSYNFGSGATYVAQDQSLGTTGSGRNVTYGILRTSGTYAASSLLIDKITVTTSASAIPEPSTYALLAGVGCLGLVIARRFRRPADRS